MKEVGFLVCFPGRVLGCPQVWDMVSRGFELLFMSDTLWGFVVGVRGSGWERLGTVVGSGGRGSGADGENN